MYRGFCKGLSCGLAVLSLPSFKLNGGDLCNDDTSPLRDHIYSLRRAKPHHFHIRLLQPDGMHLSSRVGDLVMSERLDGPRLSARDLENVRMRTKNQHSARQQRYNYQLPHFDMLVDNFQG